MKNPPCGDIDVAAACVAAAYSLHLFDVGCFYSDTTAGVRSRQELWKWEISLDAVPARLL